MRLFSTAVVALGIVTGVAAHSASGQGIVLGGMGPINRSFGGASTAAPLDSLGALYWNPATIDGLPGSEMAFGMEVALPSGELASRVSAGAFGPGVPAVTLAGSDGSEAGVAPIPSFGFVYKPDESPLSYGLGIYGIGGFAGNLAASTNNPILTPPPPIGLGVGQIAAQLDILQMAPTLCYHVTRQFSVGFSPTIVMAKLTATPAFFAAPDDANGDGFATFPSAIGTRIQWGAGFQVGAYYHTDYNWHFGASLKSPQWFETFRFNATDELGRPRALKFHVEYPLIASVGASYSGFENYLFACDLRYIDYANTPGFKSEGFDSSGSLSGLGWSSVLVVATGVERRISDRLTVRAGYDFNENPIPAANTAINVASALIIQHWLCLGMSYRFLDNAVGSLSYVHGFHNSITGPMLTAAGPVPGTSVTSTASFDSLAAGITLQF